jgi:hypothetical protein
MQHDYLVHKLRQDVLPKISAIGQYNTIFDTIEALERMDIALMVLTHLMQSGYSFFWMDGKFRLVDVLSDESVYYEGETVEEILISLIIQSLTGE